MWTQIRSFRWQTSSSAPLDMMVNFSAIFAIYTNGLEPITTKFLKMKFTSSQYVTQIIWKLAFYLNYRDCRTAVYHDGLEPLLQQVGLLHVLRERQSMWQLISCNCGATQETQQIKEVRSHHESLWLPTLQHLYGTSSLSIIQQRHRKSITPIDFLILIQTADELCQRQEVPFGMFFWYVTAYCWRAHNSVFYVPRFYSLMLICVNNYKNT